MSETKIVFLQLVDGTPAEHTKLQMILRDASRGTNFRFIVNPTANNLKSIGIDELKGLIKQIEQDV